MSTLCRCAQGACEFTRENVREVENCPGLYAFFDTDMDLLYVGVSNVLRHRLQSYYQKDDFDAHPTKRALRRRIAYFYHEYMPITEARKLEKEVKEELRYNHR
jgi:excinuclease UvrABC nuclease subunit